MAGELLYRLVMKRIAVVVGLALAGCGGGVSHTGRAHVENALAVDGCAWLVTMGSEEFTPDGASIAKLEPLMAGMSRDFDLAFTTTGKTKTVHCGWSQRADVREIAIAVAAPVP